MIYQNRIHYFKQNILNPFFIYSGEDVYDERDAEKVFRLTEDQAIERWDAIIECYYEKGMFVNQIKYIEKVFPHECINHKNKIYHIKSYLNGYEIQHNGKEWIFSDTKESTEKTYRKRPCVKCGKFPTKDGHDYCIQNLPGVMNACCGHGVSDGYIQFSNGIILRFNNLRIDKD